MTEQDAYVPGSDPRRAIADGRLAMKEARRDLQEALVGAHLPKEYDDADLDDLLDEIAERVAQRLAGGEESQPETTTDTAPRGSFDGGARQSLPPAPPTHAEWLGEVLRTRAADRGMSFQRPTPDPHPGSAEGWSRFRPSSVGLEAPDEQVEARRRRDGFNERASSIDLGAGLTGLSHRETVLAGSSDLIVHVIEELEIRC